MNESDRQLSRRTLLAGGIAAAAAAAIGRADAQYPPAGASASIAAPSASRRRALRFAHATDIHVQPELRAGEGMAACLRHMMSLQDRPSLIVTGGDLAMDTAATDLARSRVQWELFHRVLADNLEESIPVYHTLGNHDIFGRYKSKARATGSEPYYGKRWFLNQFGYERTFRSFDAAGWHFVILDSIALHADGKGFTPRIAGEQLDWLKQDLARTSAPTVVVSHVPIVSVVNFFDAADKDWKTGSTKFEVGSSRMHADCRALDALFQRHRHVRLCLSGHVHLLDRCTYNGVTYICDGAASAAKWTGPKRQTAEGYGVIDLYDDGTFEHQYATFGWRA